MRILAQLWHATAAGTDRASYPMERTALSKRHQKRHRKTHRVSRAARPERQPPELEARLREATKLLEDGQLQEAVDLLEPLSMQYPRAASLHHSLAAAYTMLGDLWAGLDGFERAFELTHDPVYWEPLARLYLQLELNAHALHAFRQLLRSSSRQTPSRAPAPPPAAGIGEILAWLEQEVRQMADGLRIPALQAEQGLRHLEDGSLALQRGDYSACAGANRKAIKLLGDWPPPHNNLSLALFFGGRPEEAIATARRVLSHDPDNIQALSNLCRFTAWTGRVEEAQTFWTHLATLNPSDPSDRLKMAEAAAILEEDRNVYDLLRPMLKRQIEDDMAPPFQTQAQLLFAVAEANLGKRGAVRRLEAVQDQMPGAASLLEAVKAGRPGPGSSGRFPYFAVSEMLPGSRMQELIDLVARRDKLAERQFRNLMDRFLARYPQAVLVAEKLLWETEEPAGAVMLLDALGSPAAHSALRRFGLSQAGSDSARMEALHRLGEAGQIKPADTLRVWVQGEWRDIQLRTYEISEQERPKRDSQTADLLRRGEQALQAGDDGQAEQLFRRALERDPHATEALNNIGTIYARHEDHSQARQMFRAALELDPDYVIPRCNLVTYLLDDGDLEAAEEMLAPLAERAHFRPREMAYYTYLQARLHAQREDYDTARSALEMALGIVPDFEPAQSMLERIEMLLAYRQTSGSFFERMHKRDQAKRRRLQARLSTPEPRLAEALPLYSREVLASMARLVWPHKRWSGLRKAELLAELVETFQWPEAIDRIVADLNEGERTALRCVLAQGSQMPWTDFDAQFGNDLEESAYWQWHEPETTMGRLRQRGLLVETTVDAELLLAIPLELRQPLTSRLGTP
jgi:Flp pilus assembly protein TadD